MKNFDIAFAGPAATFDRKDAAAKIESAFLQLADAYPGFDHRVVGILEPDSVAAVALNIARRRGKPTIGIGLLEMLEEPAVVVDTYVRVEDPGRSQAQHDSSAHLDQLHRVLNEALCTQADALVCLGETPWLDELRDTFRKLHPGAPDRLIELPLALPLDG